MTLSWLWGALTAVALLALASWLFLVVLEWALSMKSGGNPQLEDEDEIDHRFY